jgi:hypothetical protein
MGNCEYFKISHLGRKIWRDVKGLYRLTWQFNIWCYYSNKGKGFYGTYER